MTRKEVIGELRELKYMFERRYDKYPTCLEEAINYIYQTPCSWLPIDKEKLEAGELIEDGTWCFFTNGESVSVERYKADVIGHFFPPGRFFSLDEAIAFIPISEELFESAKHVGRSK